MVSELGCALSTRQPRSRGCSLLLRHQDSPSHLLFASQKHRLHCKAWLGAASRGLPPRGSASSVSSIFQFLTSLESEE